MPAPGLATPLPCSLLGSDLPGLTQGCHPAAPHPTLGDQRRSREWEPPFLPVSYPGEAGSRWGRQGNRIIPLPPPSSLSCRLQLQVSQLLRPWDHHLVEASPAPFCRLENGGPKSEHESPRSQCSSLVEQRLERSSSWLSGGGRDLGPARPSGRGTARAWGRKGVPRSCPWSPRPGKAAPEPLSEWQRLARTIKVYQGCPL